MGFLILATNRGYACLNTSECKLSMIPVIHHFLNGKFPIPKESNTFFSIFVL